MKLLKHYILFLTFLLPSVMSKADVGTIATKSADTDGGITYYTYTRTGVSANTWESFCLPMDIDINSLQTYFDIIYLAYDDEELEFYNDFDEASSAVKRRKTTSNASGITATAEAYSEESGYWTDAEEAAAATTRYCFAYSAEESSYYHYYIADFSSESSVIIPQGMPFFAHVKSDADLTNGLVLTGHLNTTDTPQTGLVDKEFKVYKDLNLTTLDTDKGFHVIGSLSATDTYSGTLYTISGTGTTTTASTLQQYRAYLTGIDATAILIYPKTRTELENIETPIEATDPELTLHLTDSAPTLVAGTYAAGNVDYTRTGSYIVDGNYSSFCLPFDFNVSDAPCFNKIYVPIDVAFNNTTTNLLQIFLVNQTGVVKAGTPFLARLTGNDIYLTNASTVTYNGTSTNPDEVELTVFDSYGSSSVLTSNESIKLYWGGTLNLTKAKTGMNTFNLNGSFGPSSFDLNPFRAYLVETTTSSSTGSTKLHNIEILFDEEPTAIYNLTSPNKQNVDVYSANGILLRKNVNVKSALDGLSTGLYIVNGNKIFNR